MGHCINADHSCKVPHTTVSSIRWANSKRNLAWTKTTVTGKPHASATGSQHGHSCATTIMSPVPTTGWIIWLTIPDKDGIEATDTGLVVKGSCHSWQVLRLLSRMSIETLLSNLLKASRDTVALPPFNSLISFLSWCTVDLRPIPDWSAMCQVRKWANVLFRAWWCLNFSLRYPDMQCCACNDWHNPLIEDRAVCKGRIQFKKGRQFWSSKM